MRQKVGKELRSALRLAEKLRERTSQKLIRHVKTLQDRKTKDRLHIAKLISDSLQVSRTNLDKSQSNFLKELQVWQRHQRERLHQGRDVLRGITDPMINLAGQGPKVSSGRSSRSNFADPMQVLSDSNNFHTLLPISSISTSQTQLSFAKNEKIVAMQSFLIPGALVEFLHNDAAVSSASSFSSATSAQQVSDTSGPNTIGGSGGSGKLRPTEALHALLECFASARRVLND